MSPYLESNDTLTKGALQAYLKFGRRPVMLITLLAYLLGLVGASRSTSYGGLMAARLIHALASGVCEALPVQLVNDIFFRKLLLWNH